MIQTTINQRFANFLIFKKISQEEFSKISGITSATVSNIAKGDTKLPKADFFQAIAIHFPEINLRWLLLGEGSMELSPGELPTIAREPESEAAYKKEGQLPETWEDVLEVLKDLSKAASIIPDLWARIERLERLKESDGHH